MLRRPGTEGLRERRATPIHNVKQPGAGCAPTPLFEFLEPQFFSNRSSRSRGACGAPGILRLVATPARGWRSADRRQP